MGCSNWERAKIDEATENIKDMYEITSKLMFHKKEDEKVYLEHNLSGYICEWCMMYNVNV